MKAEKPAALLLIASLAFILLFPACSPKEEIKIPDDVIALDTMTLFLTDIHLIEGASVGKKIMGDDSLNVDDYHAMVFSKYKASKKEFETSFDFYSRHPDLMKQIYEGVIENLNKTPVVPPRESLEGDEDTVPERDSLAEPNPTSKYSNPEKL